MIGGDGKMKQIIPLMLIMVIAIVGIGYAQDVPVEVSPLTADVIIQRIQGELDKFDEELRQLNETLTNLVARQEILQTRGQELVGRAKSYHELLIWVDLETKKLENAEPTEQ